MPCSHCGGIGHNRTTCPQKASSSSSAMAAKWYCQKCRVVRRAGKFCADCGTKLVEQNDIGASSASSSSSSSHNRRALGALHVVHDGNAEMRWTYAAALEAHALTEFRRTRHVSNAKAWAKLKHATFIVLHRTRDRQHNGGQIRTWRDAKNVYGVGETSAAFLEKTFAPAKKKRAVYLPGSADGPFPTTAEAILVALLKWRIAHGSTSLCPWHVLRDNARELYKSPPNSSLSPEMVFPDYEANKKLACWKTCHTLGGGTGKAGGVGGSFYIEERTQSKTRSFRLTEDGVVMAELIRKRARDATTTSNSSSSSSSSSSSTSSKRPQGRVIKQYHGQSLPDSDGLVMFLDHREGGGEARSLDRIYNKMKAQRLQQQMQTCARRC